MINNLQELITKTEKNHFRTDSDTGANEHAMLVWNIVREFAGLPRLYVKDLPAFCKTHGIYHKIQEGYGCVRK